MFAIALRFIGSGSPETAFSPAIPVMNAALQLDRADDGRWRAVAKGEGHGVIYVNLADALDDYKEITNGVFTKENAVGPIVEDIGAFIEQYRDRNAAYQVFFEIQFLNPTTITEQPVDLDLF